MDKNKINEPGRMRILVRRARKSNRQGIPLVMPLALIENLYTMMKTSPFMTSTTAAMSMTTMVNTNQQVRFTADRMIL